jgi:hypothetical protein
MAMTQQDTNTTTTTLSKESRAALRKALREQLETVRKKVRHMRAKSLTGGGGGGEGKSDAKDGHKTASVAREQTDRNRSDVRGKSGGDLDAQKQKGRTPEDATTTNGGEEELRDEAEEFFARGVRPKVGKTKSVVARIMSSEQRSFAQDHRKPPASQKKGARKK